MEEKFIPISKICKLACQTPDQLYQDLPCSDYLSRMNLFKIWGMPYKEIFTRNCDEGRFIPLTALTDEETTQVVVDKIILLVLQNMRLDHPQKTIANLERCINEILCNISQHAEAEKAFCIAQIYPAKNELQISICDNGIGFGRSFQTSSKEGMSKALQIGVSSKALGHRGNGIPILIDTILRNNGKMKIVSIDQSFDGKDQKETETFQGVSINISINLNNNFDKKGLDDCFHIDPAHYHHYFNRACVEKISVKRVNLRSIGQRLHNQVFNLVKAGLKPVLDFSCLETSLSESFKSEIKIILSSFPCVKIDDPYQAFKFD